MKNKIYYVYKVTNLKNNRIYVGVHYGYPDDAYLGSGTVICEAIKKYGRENFKKEVLIETPDYDTAYDIESILVDEDFISRPDVYNVRVGGYGNPNIVHKEHPDTKAVCLFGVQYSSIAECSRQTSLYYKKIHVLCGDPSKQDCYFLNIEKQHSAEEFFEEYQKSWENKRKKLSELATKRFKGKKIGHFSDEHRKHLSESCKNSEKFQERLQVWNRSDEKKRKTADTHRGMKRSVEARHNMSLAKKGRQTHTKNCYMAYSETGKRHYLPIGSKLPEGWTWSKNAQQKMLKS